VIAEIYSALSKGTPQILNPLKLKLSLRSLILRKVFQNGMTTLTSFGFRKEKQFSSSVHWCHSVKLKQTERKKIKHWKKEKPHKTPFGFHQTQLDPAMS